MKTSPWVLYTYPETLSCLAVEIALHECKVPFKRHLLDPKKKKFKTFLQRSPMGRLPVLVEELHGGEFAVSETPAILQYIAERFRDTELWVTNLDSKSEIFAWMSFLDSSFRELVLSVCYASSSLEDSKDGLLLERQLKTLDSYLSSRAFLVGGYSVADICAIPFLNLLRKNPHIFWDGFPHLSSWYDRLSARRGYQRALKQN